MKRIALLATAAALAAAAPARAQGIPVIDIQANLRLIEQTIHNAKDYVMQDLHLAKMVETLREAKYYYNEVNALTSIHDVGSALGYVQTRVPLPSDTAEVVSMMQGLSYGGSVSQAVLGYLDRNTVYQPPGQDFQALRINQNATGNAGTMALAEAAFRASASRLEGADQLQSRLATARTQAEKQDMIAKANIENGRALALIAQLQSAALMAQARVERNEQVLEQERRMSADLMVQEADAVIRSGGRRPASARSLVASR
jgi:type IV secretion system protein VirB5